MTGLNQPSGYAQGGQTSTPVLLSWNKEGLASAKPEILIALRADLTAEILARQELLAKQLVLLGVAQKQAPAPRKRATRSDKGKTKAPRMVNDASPFDAAELTDDSFEGA